MSWITSDTFVSIPFIKVFRFIPKSMIFENVFSSSLSKIFYLSDRILAEISIVFNILFNDSSSWEFINSQIWLDAVLSLIFHQWFSFTKNMCLMIKFPIIITILLFTTSIVVMGIDIKLVCFVILFEFNIVWSYNIFSIIIIKSSLISI